MTVFFSSDSRIGVPAGKREANTRLSVVDGSRGRNVQWTWYYGCVQEMLREVGCPAEAVDDVAHDLIINRLMAICESYEPGKGRFRPYLHRCVANFWRDRIRAHSRHGSARHQQLDASEAMPLPEEPSEPTTRPNLGQLSGFLDQTFARFMRDQTRRDVGFFLLRHWCLTGGDVNAAIVECRLSVSTANAYKLRAKAITLFAQFAQEHLDPEDLAEMNREAEQAGESAGLECGPLSLVSALRWPSERKRLGIVAKILRHLYVKYQKLGGSFDSL